MHELLLNTIFDGSIHRHASKSCSAEWRRGRRGAHGRHPGLRPDHRLTAVDSSASRGSSEVLTATSSTRASMLALR